MSNHWQMECANVKFECERLRKKLVGGVCTKPIRNESTCRLLRGFHEICHRLFINCRRPTKVHNIRAALLSFALCTNAGRVVVKEVRSALLDMERAFERARAAQERSNSVLTIERSPDAHQALQMDSQRHLRLPQKGEEQ